MQWYQHDMGFNDNVFRPVSLMVKNDNDDLSWAHIEYDIAWKLLLQRKRNILIKFRKKKDGKFRQRTACEKFIRKTLVEFSIFQALIKIRWW